jgi:membrane protease YdiL (CAAX protease family)
MHSSNFILFLSISFGISVPIFYYSTLQSSPGLIAGILPAGSYMPASRAWIASGRDGGDAKAEFRQRLSGWGGAGWIWFAVLIPTVIWLFSFGTSTLIGITAQPMWAALAALPVIYLVKYGEEVGWRGYALPFLLKRFNPITASLVLGIIWTFFHAALYWQRPAFGLLTSVVIVLLSIVLAWMFINTSSILPGTLLHAIFNTWTQVFINPENASLLTVAILFIGLVAGYLFIRYRRGLVVVK